MFYAAVLNLPFQLSGRSVCQPKNEIRKLPQRASSRPHTHTQTNTPTIDFHLQYSPVERHCTDGDEEILIVYPEPTMATDADIVPQVVTDFVFDLYDSVTLSQLVEEQSRFYNTVFRDLSSKVRSSPFVAG